MKVNIIGGGIGGLMTALCLLKNGINVSVFEQSRFIEDAGAGIWMGPNALAILNKYGLEEAIIKEGKLLSAARIRKTNGREISHIDFEKQKIQYGFGNVAIHRAKLHKLLAEALPSGIIQKNKVCSGFLQYEHKVEAVFLDGSSVGGEILIGADGISSGIRKQMYPDIDLRYSGQCCWRFLVDFGLPADDSATMYETWGDEKGLRFGYSYINQRTVYCYITAYFKKPLDVLPGNTKPFISKICRSLPEINLRLINAADERNFIYKPIYDLPMKRSWVKGNIALLGDAAHATTPDLGQGGCQAIEDAYALGLCLHRGGNIAESLKEYERLRIDKVKSLANASRVLSQVTNLDGWKKRLAITVIKNTPAFMKEIREHKMYSIAYLERKRSNRA